MVVETVGLQLMRFRANYLGVPTRAKPVMQVDGNTLLRLRRRAWPTSQVNQRSVRTAGPVSCLQVTKMRLGDTRGVVVADLNERHILVRSNMIVHRPDGGKHTVLCAVVVMTAVEWLGLGFADLHVAVHVMVVIWMVHAVGGAMDAHVLDQ